MISTKPTEEIKERGQNGTRCNFSREHHTAGLILTKQSYMTFQRKSCPNNQSMDHFDALIFASLCLSRALCRFKLKRCCVRVRRQTCSDSDFLLTLGRTCIEILPSPAYNGCNISDRGPPDPPLKWLTALMRGSLCFDAEPALGRQIRGGQDVTGLDVSGPLRGRQSMLVVGFAESEQISSVVGSSLLERSH